MAICSRFKEAPSQHFQSTAAKEMIKIAELTGGQPDLIWSFDNSRFFDMDAWKQQRP